MTKPRIVIRLEGGCVQAVLSDTPVELMVVDYDTDGGDPAEMDSIPQNDGSTVEAFVTTFDCLPNKEDDSFIQRLFSLFNIN